MLRDPLFLAAVLATILLSILCSIVASALPFQPQRKAAQVPVVYVWRGAELPMSSHVEDRRELKLASWHDFDAFANQLLRAGLEAHAKQRR